MIFVRIIMWLCVVAAVLLIIISYTICRADIEAEGAEAVGPGGSALAVLVSIVGVVMALILAWNEDEG